MSQTVPEFGGCPWPIDPACFTDEWNAHSPEVQERAVALASATLERLVANRVSNCSITIRPCLDRGGWCFIPTQGALWAGLGGAFAPGMNAAGQWVNSCGCGTQHACGAGDDLILPSPVGRVDEVKVDGAALDPVDYRVEENRVIWMGVGEAPWLGGQNLSRSDSELGTFSVTYLNAYPVDAIGAFAAGVLAREYAKACTGSNKCRLPTGVTTVVRQGLSMEINSGAFPDGLTGIREVDTFIALWNPNGLQRQTTVWSPDQRRVRTASGVRPSTTLYGGTF